MDTSTYFFAGYLVFWLLPTFYLIRLSRKLSKMEEEFNQLKRKS